ncbi:amidase [Paenarthrobacter nitroguajacolicus]|uniref:amidase n=1 Tax=Paenarthrobacter nitroguajacolicus TaxID=211146 RepID=UPI0028581043|nr:amidase [Paenarthrobacter nitroguajacolicus]MDR6637024.1 Asp-tRNA(Asn)/Glu-tRNA(Gln) amidotransferase A subunit family amidase [Paenarthrobacter nitroguajacolicus]
MNLFQPWPLAQLVHSLRTGRTDIESVYARARGRVADTEDTVRAWVEFAPAVPVRSSGSLRGVPIGVKDIIDLRGLPTRCGSSLRKNHDPAETDAAIVQAWRSAGASPLGKTVTTEFAFFSPGPTDNPAAPGHTPGGSSSGSAAAVAAGQVPLAIGSQTAGSVIRPASYCGVAAMVLTRERFPTDGVVGLSESLDSHGFFTAGVSDLTVAWSALSGERVPPPSPPRILLWQVNIGDVSDAMAEAVQRSGHMLAASGAEVSEFSDNELIAELAEAHPVVMAYEAARERSVELEHADQLSTALRELLVGGSHVSDADYTDARELIRQGSARIRELIGHSSIILGPGALGAAPDGHSATGDPLLSRPWQALGLPVTAIPGLRDGQGLPLGLQVVAAPGAEAQLLAGAAWVEEQIRR